MIHVNVRGLVVRKSANGKQLLIQLRKRAGEPESYELPGGRINEYEKMLDGLRREIMEETGLTVEMIHGEQDSVITTGRSFSMECIKPYASYQTIEGPVDSFGVYFLCEAEGEPQREGDDSADVHWAGFTEVRTLINEKRFSEIDLPAVLMFLRDENNKAIFWDCDGTLVRENESFKCSLLRALKEFGYSVAEEEVKRFLREACSWNKPEEDHGDANGEEWWQRLLVGMRLFCEEQGVSPADAVAVCNAFRKNVVSYEYEAYPDTKKVLRYFSEKGYKHYIISNNFPELREVFVRLGLDEEIAGYFISASVGYDKPRKEMFEYAMAQAGNPEVCYMIGDNPVADYEGSLNAGMKPVLVHKKVEDKVCCEQLTDLFDIITE